MAKYEHELSAFDGLGLDDVTVDDCLSYLLSFVQTSAGATPTCSASSRRLPAPLLPAQLRPDVCRRHRRRPRSRTRQRHGRRAMAGRQRTPARPRLRRKRLPHRRPRRPAAGASRGSAYDPGHAYHFGLERVLDGLAALIDNRPDPHATGALSQRPPVRTRNQSSGTSRPLRLPGPLRAAAAGRGRAARPQDSRQNWSRYCSSPSRRLRACWNSSPSGSGPVRHRSA